MTLRIHEFLSGLNSGDFGSVGKSWAEKICLASSKGFEYAIHFRSEAEMEKKEAAKKESENDKVEP